MKNIFKRWFSSKTEQTIDDSQNPWAGLASYEDPETAERKLKFCGRDDDSYDVARLIMGNVFVTLYGKSGIGKTSLLNAGVFPELREEQYIPLSLRLGIRDETCPKSYQSIIVEAIQQKVNRFETIHVIDEQTDLQAVDYLWNYFARHRFFDKYDEPVTPVIVLDQFEEVFRSDRKEAEVLLRQLDYLNDKDHTLDNCTVDGKAYRYEQNYRFVVSIREDDLYRLEDSIDNCYLPALKRCRYRLRSLSEQGARDVILIPGEGLFKKEEQDGIASRIIEKSRNTDGSISTNIISLLCSRIFIDFMRSGADHISPALVDSFLKGNPFERFYNEATRGLSAREKSYIEEHLVDGTGRRNSLPESDFLRHIPKGSILLEGQSKILQRTSTSSDAGNYRVELIHDSFCEPLAALKEKRERRKRVKWIAGLSALILLALSILAAITYLYLQNQSHYQSMQVNQSKLLAGQATRLANDNDSYTARLVALQALPPNLPYTIEAESAFRMACMYNDAVLRGHTSNVTSAAFSPNGKRIVSASDDMTIRIWDVQTGKQIGLPLQGHTNNVNSAAFSPDGKRIASASDDMTIRIWDAELGKQIGLPIQGHTDNVNSVTFSPDGRRIVSASDDKTIRIWDVETGKQIGLPLQGHTDKVNSAAFSPDGKKIVSASSDFRPSGRRIISDSEDNTIRIWNAETGEQIGLPIKGHTRSVSSVAFSPDGKQIVSASYDKTIRIWNAETGKQIGSPLEGHNFDINSVAFSPDGKRIVSASSDETICIWDTETRKLIGLPLKGHAHVVSSAAFSPDGKSIVSASSDKTIRIWDTEKSKQISMLLIGHAKVVRSVAFSIDGKRIVSASDDNTIRIWDAETGKQIGLPLEGHKSAVKSIAFSPDGKLIVSASYDKTIRIWDAEKGGQIGLPLEGHTESVNSVAFSPDGKRIVSASNDKTIRIWDTKTGKQIGVPLEGHTAAFSPNGKRIVSASDDNTIRIWDVGKGIQIGLPLKGHTDHVNSAVFSPNGKLIASASSDRTIYIWDAESGKQIGIPIQGHTYKVNSVAFSPDGKRIVSASDDKTIRIWDVETGKQIGFPLMGHSMFVNSAAFSPDGRKIISASWDETIQIWDYPLIQDLIEETLKRFKDRPLTQEEKQRYFIE
jgi:WD40 repeat protein